MKKRTPDAKAWFGITTGGVVAVLVGLISRLGYHVSGVELAWLTSSVGLVGHFLGTYLAPYEPRVEEIVAEAEKIWQELHS